MSQFYFGFCAHFSFTLLTQDPCDIGVHPQQTHGYVNILVASNLSLYKNTLFTGNAGYITGLSLRGGGRGFPPATKNVAPAYFHRKIEEK